MWFGLYNAGTVLLLMGVVYVGHLAHLPQRWGLGIAVLLLCAGLANGLVSTREREPQLS